MADLSRWNVLVVENDPDARALLVRALERNRATVLSAATANEALDHLKTEHPNLGLVDLALPGTDGWELLDIVRRDARFNDVTLIAMTAFDFPDVGEEALGAGFKAYIPKPIDFRTFADDLLKIIG
jgi:CheY-like chemotaxis protein